MYLQQVYCVYTMVVFTLGVPTTDLVTMHDEHVVFHLMLQTQSFEVESKKLGLDHIMA